jgi:hypothetical protein
MTATQPTRKDLAEFFRLGLRAGVCDLLSIVRWADGIISSEPSPPFAFFDLSVCESQPDSAAISFLSEVPGEHTPDVTLHMLLGHCSRLVHSGAFAPADILVRLHRLNRTEHFPDCVDSAIRNLNEDYHLAHDGIHGTVESVARAFTDYLSRFDQYAPV